MTMQAESLEVLEKASVAPVQARAIVRAIEIEIAGAKDTLATKQDVVGLHQALDVLRADLRGEIATLGAAIRIEVAKQIGDVRAEISGVAGSLRAEISGVGGSLRAEISGVGGSLRAEIGGVTRQMYVALLGQMAVMLGFFYFFITQLR
jgi:hypothetical protein